MAINLNELRSKIDSVSQINSTILRLIDVALTGKFLVDSIEVPITTEKMTEIMNRYLELRTQLKTLVGSLP